MNVFFGLFIEEKCVCGEMVKTEYGACTPLYRDKDGNEFNCYLDGSNQCPKCGHEINSERVAEAELIGSCCY